MIEIQNRLKHLNLCFWKLPFDQAQGGELVEPFRISSFGFLVRLSSTALIIVMLRS